MADDDRLRTVDEHLADVLDGIGSIDPIELTLLDAQGLLLAENVVASVPLPGFDNSAMDGYAVRAVDTKSRQRRRAGRCCRSSATSPPGAKSRSGMGPGLAMRIMTGAPHAGRRRRGHPARGHRPRRRPGRDPATGRATASASGAPARICRRAQPALGAGAALGPQQIALLAAIGRDRVHGAPAAAGAS